MRVYVVFLWFVMRNLHTRCRRSIAPHAGALPLVLACALTLVCVPRSIAASRVGRAPTRVAPALARSVPRPSGGGGTAERGRSLLRR